MWWPAIGNKKNEEFAFWQRCDTRGLVKRAKASQSSIGNIKNKQIVFEELGDSILTSTKFAGRGLIYGLLILTVVLYDFDTCTMIFLNT